VGSNDECLPGGGLGAGVLMDRDMGLDIGSGQRRQWNRRRPFVTAAIVGELVQLQSAVPSRPAQRFHFPEYTSQEERPECEVLLKIVTQVLRLRRLKFLSAAKQAG